MRSTKHLNKQWALTFVHYRALHTILLDRKIYKLLLQRTALAFDFVAVELYLLMLRLTFES